MLLLVVHKLTTSPGGSFSPHSLVSPNVFIRIQQQTEQEQLEPHRLSCHPGMGIRNVCKCLLVGGIVVMHRSCQ